MSSRALGEALTSGEVVVLDGGLATQLEAQGHDLSSSLWSARLLAEDPDAVVAAHAAFFAAGAQVATTASYQASFTGLAAAGLDRADAERLLRLSVSLAERAREEAGRPDTYIAASVGPYGAALADGSEYRGDYGLSVAELRAWHRPRLEVLADTGADVLACETLPCLAEVEAVVAELERIGKPAWVSLTCAEGRTRAGEPVEDAFALAGSADEVLAVGVNCSGAAEAGSLVGPAAAASGLPVVLYPNRGEAWDAERRRWAGPGTFDVGAVRGWVADGARLVGGCCRVTPADVEALAGVLAADRLARR